MSNKRVKRLNSLLREVINEVIHKDVRNPQVAKLTSITEVEITKDLRYAKVYISTIGTELERKTTVDALQTAAGYISLIASKKVVMRFFPALFFKIDTSVDKQMQIESLLKEIKIPPEK